MTICNDLDVEVNPVGLSQSVITKTWLCKRQKGIMQTSYKLSYWERVQKLQLLAKQVQKTGKN